MFFFVIVVVLVFCVTTAVGPCNGTRWIDGRELQPARDWCHDEPPPRRHTMVMIVQAARAWGLSVLACVLLLVLWTLSQHALSGRWESAGRNALDVAAAFGSIFAVVAATLHVPIFLILSMLAPENLTRSVAVLVGAALAPVVYVALAMAFTESEGPPTGLEWVKYWVSQPGRVLAGAAPFAVAGAVFGFAWVWADGGRSQR